MTRRILHAGAVALLFAAIWSVPAPSAALEYYESHEQGWFWYQDPPPEPEPPEKEEDGQEKPPAAPGPADPSDPLVQLEAIQQEIERLQAEAVLNPSEETLLEFLRANLWQIRQGKIFADVARRVIWANPDLDTSIQYPTMQVATHIWHDQRNERREQTVRKLARTHGLFFFFRSDCPYCHRFAPILARIQARYGIEVLPISLDGGALPDYPAPRRDNGLSARLGVTTVPSLFLVEPTSGDVIPIGAGLLSEHDVIDRIFVLTQTQPGEMYR